MLIQVIIILISVFGGWNGISFGVCMSLGYLSLLLLNVFTRRIVHEIHLHNNLRILEITFFNAFWVIDN
jgi:hypothetical protein